MTRYWYFILIIAIVFSCKKKTVTVQPNPTVDNLIKGADISWITQMESSGYKFYNSNGTQQDCFQILKDKKINAVRLRAWVNPSDGWCNTKDLVVKAVRAKNFGMKTLLDLHYSDIWADPGHQQKPSAWKALSFDSLTKIVYQYTLHVMDTLKTNGIVPDWVQIGNETNDGMLWEDGRASTNMKNFTALVNAGYNAVKAISTSTKVIVHISNGFDDNLFRWIFDGLQTNGANWDIIGLSLYPGTNNWVSLDAQCLTTMNDMVARYNKEVMVCEIGMDVSDPVNSRDFISDIIKKTRAVTNGKGLGVFYWEPESYNWGYNKGAFDPTGKPTIALDGFVN